MIAVVGAYGGIKNIDSFIKQLLVFSEKERLVVQAFDATMIYSDDHLISATAHAKRAFQQGTNATGSLALEILLYAAGERQIEKAIKKMGVKKGRKKIVFVLTDPLEGTRKKTIDETVKRKLLKTFDLQLDEKAIQGDTGILKRFGITDQELSTIPKDHYGDLILEKVALVDIIKK
jgi:KEOPS complex subunit Cgi121